MNIYTKYMELFILFKNIKTQIEDYTDECIDEDSCGTYDLLPRIVCTSMRYKQNQTAINTLYELGTMILSLRKEHEKVLEMYPDISGCLCLTCPSSSKKINNDIYPNSVNMKFFVWRNKFDYTIRENICMCCQSNKIQLTIDGQDVHCVYAGGRDEHGNRNLGLVCTVCYKAIGNSTIKKYKSSIK